MKTWIKLWMVISILWMGYGAAAQTSEAYWVVEGNLNKPDYTIIHFYNSQHQKISEERVEGRFLDIRKKRNVMLLNKKLSRLTETNNEAFARNNRKDSIK
jgi:hypothetical protein